MSIFPPSMAPATPCLQNTALKSAYVSKIEAGGEAGEGRGPGDYKPSAVIAGLKRWL